MLTVSAYAPTALGFTLFAVTIGQSLEWTEYGSVHFARVAEVRFVQNCCLEMVSVFNNSKCHSSLTGWIVYFQNASLEEEHEENVI